MGMIMKNTIFPLELIPCLFCQSNESNLWATENGFNAVKCRECGLIYVNPRNAQSVVDKAVTTGHHSEVQGGRNVVGRRSKRKVSKYRRVLGTILRMFGPQTGRFRGWILALDSARSSKHCLRLRPKEVKSMELNQWVQRHKTPKDEGF